MQEMMLSIQSRLQETSLPEDSVDDLTESIAFSVAAIFDASAVMELDGKPVVPFLAFADERNGDNLIAEEGGSYMHEYVFGMLDEIEDEVGEE